MKITLKKDVKVEYTVYSIWQGDTLLDTTRKEAEAERIYDKAVEDYQSGVRYGTFTMKEQEINE